MILYANDRINKNNSSLDSNEHLLRVIRSDSERIQAHSMLRTYNTVYSMYSSSVPLVQQYLKLVGMRAHCI